MRAVAPTLNWFRLICMSLFYFKINCAHLHRQRHIKVTCFYVIDTYLLKWAVSYRFSQGIFFPRNILQEKLFVQILYMKMYIETKVGIFFLYSAYFGFLAGKWAIFYMWSHKKCFKTTCESNVIYSIFIGYILSPPSNGTCLNLWKIYFSRICIPMFPSRVFDL